MLDYCSNLANSNCAGVAFHGNETEELQNGGLGKNHIPKKSEMVKRSETKSQTDAKDENSAFIVNSLLFFMNHRQKSTALDSTFQMMLNYYNFRDKFRG